MQLIVNDVEAFAPVTLRAKPMSADEFFEYCAQYPNFRLERKAGGEIVIMPPAGGETGRRNTKLTFQLEYWSETTKRGQVFDCNTGFVLPDSSILSPDGAWVLNTRLDRLTKAQRRKYLPLCPEFIIELTSPTDRLKAVKRKMRDWMNNGAALGWLLDPDRKTAYIYRPGLEPEILEQPTQLVGEGPIAGFVLDLGPIWAEL